MMPEESTSRDLPERARRLRQAFDRGAFDLALRFHAPGEARAGSERRAQDRG